VLQRAHDQLGLGARATANVTKVGDGGGGVIGRLGSRA
jgi:hypothetical protein